MSLDPRRCELCGQWIEGNTPDQEAHARVEARLNFPELDLDDESARAIVCDDCFQKIDPARN